MVERITRRHLLATAAGTAAITLLAACSPSAATSSPTAGATAASAPTTAPTVTTTATTGTTSTPTAAAATTPTAAAAPTATAGQASSIAAPVQLPRNQTLIMSLSDAVNQFSDPGLMNPFMPGVTRNGWQFGFEPLYFYDMWNTQQTCGPQGVACKDGEIPWLAESYAYNQDSTELTIKLRKGVTWSDGQPFTASDVAFTLNMLKDNAPKLTYAVEMKQWVKAAVAVDPQTARITLTGPNPRFMFTYFEWHSDLGVPIVPEHIFKGKDPTTFTNFDLAKGWPVVTGPWRLTLDSPEQRFWDRRDNWWGATTGFHPLPKMKRVLLLPNYSDEKQLELLTNNQADCTHGFQAAFTVPTALKTNPKVIAWTTGNKPPYGALDIATVTTLDFNDSKPPYDDPDIRWAINHSINRDQIVAIGSHGIGAKVVLPFEPYGQLQPYYDKVADILKTYPIDSFDLAKTAQIMQSKGYVKDSGGFWAKGGKRFSIVLTAPPPFFNDIAPIIVAQLRKGGFDAAFKSPSNSSTIIQEGQIDAFLDIPGGAFAIPTIRLPSC